MTGFRRSKLVLDTRVLEAWEIAARLHMLLIEPSASEKRMRDLVTRACAEQIKRTIVALPERRADFIRRYPQYDPRLSRTQSKNAIPKLEDAQRMGAAVLALIKEAKTGELPIINGVTVRPSIDFLVKQLWPRLPDEAEEKYEERAHMAERRKLRARFAVAHLAAGLTWLSREAQAAGARMVFDYQNLAFHRRWVALAAEFAADIRCTPKLQILADSLIQVAWIEPQQDFDPAQTG